MDGKTAPVGAEAPLTDQQRARARTTLQAGRARAMQRHPYLAVALARMVCVECDDVPSYAVDVRWRLYYNPRVVLAEPIAECEASWIHEVNHRLRAHSERFRALAEPFWRVRVFNYVSDAFINTDLIELGLAVGESWRITLDSLPVPAERTEAAEAVYRRLCEHLRRESRRESKCSESQCSGCGRPGPPDDDAGPCPGCADAGGLTEATGDAESAVIDAALGSHDCGSGAAGEKRPWEHGDEDTGDGSVDPGSAELIRQDTARQILQHQRSDPGSVGGDLLRWAEGLLDPQVDWRTELRSTLSRALAARLGLHDYSYSRPSHRAPSPWTVLPGMVGKEPPAVAWVQDTSGSMSRDDLTSSIAEAKAVLRQASRGGRRLQVIACDASAQEAQTIRAIEDVVLVGGYGTDLRAGMRAAAALRPRVDVVVVATDGETPWPDEPPAENPRARYVALLVRGDATYSDVPHWMRKIVING